MNYEFPIPPLNESKGTVPNQLIQLASKYSNSYISIPTVDKVLQAIQEGNIEKISKLEWIYCIYAKASWDEENLDKRWKSSYAIWTVAIENLWLQKQLLWRLAFYYSGQGDKVLSKSLADSFEVLTNTYAVNQRLPVKIIQALRSENPGHYLAKIACEKNLNSSELKAEIYHDLPTWIPLFNQLLEFVTPYFSSIFYPCEQQVSWLLRCLEEISSEKQPHAVNHLLIHIPKEIANQHSQLVEWLRKNYRYGAKWNQLSEQAKQKLRELIGVVNYNDFQKLVDLILNKIHLVEWETNQLRRRRDFWADYTNRFEKFRILLPQSSMNIISGKLEGDIDILEDDGSDSTEVCIFDFGDWLVVELFRGIGSETRLFPNNSKNQQLLFSKSKLSVKKIRYLGGEKHDHKFLWQVSCRQWLEEKGIYTNPGSEIHKNPTSEQLYQRRKKLVSWESDIERLELEAKVYCNKIGFEAFW